MSVKILRVKIYQPEAHYRIPYSYQRRLTYPIPPYSTVKGLICNLLGIDNEEKFKNLKNGLSLAIYGRYESLVKEYIWFRNLKKSSHTDKFGSVKNRSINGIIQHPGGQAPVKIDVLYNVDLIIYIYHKDVSKLEEIKRAFESPAHRLSSLHLGRAEDWIVIKEVKVFEPKKGKVRIIKDYCTWVPKPEYVFYNLLGNSGELREGYEGFYKNLNANIFRIGLYYKIVQGERIFDEFVETKLYEGQGFRPFNFYLDPDSNENLPLFFYTPAGG
ncbi:MAG: type I-B CRISPR-associated protein Cas5b [Caldimicrobium sp.]